MPLRLHLLPPGGDRSEEIVVHCRLGVGRQADAGDCLPGSTPCLIVFERVRRQKLPEMKKAKKKFKTPAILELDCTSVLCQRGSECRVVRSSPCPLKGILRHMFLVQTDVFDYFEDPKSF